MPQTKPYHHGNLRSTLLDQSMVLIRDQGLARFTFRQLAAQTGVSHTAAYRHFRGKDHLVASLAETILKRIADRIAYHSLKGMEARECLEMGALAMLKYCLEKPDEFKLLLELTAEGGEVKDPAVEALSGLAAKCKLPPPAAQLIYSLLHGVADLALRKQAGYESRKQAVESAKLGVRALIAGL